MHIVEAYARLMPPPHVDLSDGWKPFEKEHGLQLIRRVEWCARISHRTEEKQTAESYARFLQTWVMEHGDFSTIEHCGISADLIVDRGLSHELVRHRLAKILDLDIDVGPPEVTQESTRFVNYGKTGGSIGMVLPPKLAEIFNALRFSSYGDIENQLNLSVHELRDFIIEKEIVGLPPNGQEALRLATWYQDYIIGGKQAERHYFRQLELKVTPEETRDMLPHCTATRMVMTHNLRNWRHLMIMRTTSETHRKLRPLMQNVLAELQEKVPILFADLESNQRQAQNLKKGR